MKKKQKLTLNYSGSQNMESLRFNFSGAKKRYETLNGKQYLVVPMVMLTEGVHAGSSGPLYYPREELRKTPVVWNTKPLVVYHPQQNGQGVSACTPEVLETRSVGIVMNSHFNGKLRAEAWFDEPKLKKVDKRVWDALQKNQKVEVSTGLFTDNVEKKGVWNGEEYVAIATNYRPDHLAILPDQKGACSIADGAGLLQNAQALLNTDEGEGFTAEDQEILMNYGNRWPAAKRHKLPGKDFAGPHESFPIKTQKDVMSAVKLAHHAKNPTAVMARVKKIAKRKGLTLPPSLQDKNATTNAGSKSPFDAGYSHGAIRKAINDELRGQVKTATGVKGPGGFIEDVYKDFFIGSNYQNGQEQYYSQPYEMEPQSGTYTGADPDKASTLGPLKVKFTGMPKAVKKVTSWHDLQGNLIANSEELERLAEAQEEAKQNFISELRAYGYKSRGELIMLQRKSVDDLALLVQRVHLQHKGIFNQDAVGATAAASTGGVPAGGSMNPGAKLFAQRKASAPAAKVGKKKRKKEMVY